MSLPFGINYEKRNRNALYIAGEIAGGFIYAPWTWFILYDASHFPGNANIALIKEQPIGEFNFTKPVFNEFDRSSFVPAAKQMAHLSDASQQPSSTASSRVLKTPGDILIGKYQCTGKLTLNGELIEYYDALTISIDKSSANELLINVYDSMGESFFNEPLKCKAEKQSDGSYVLSHSIPGVKISVSPDKKIFFQHPSILINQDIYQLDADSK